MNRYGAQRLDLYEALDQTEGLGGHPDGPRRRELLHPRCQMGGLTDRRVVEAEVRSDRADHHFSRVQSHSNPDCNAVGAERLIGVSLHELLHLQGRIAGADRMVFVGEGRTE